MHHADAGALAGERAADVHQARRVDRRADLGARVEHAADPFTVAESDGDLRTAGDKA